MQGAVMEFAILVCVLHLPLPSPQLCGFYEILFISCVDTIITCNKIQTVFTL